MEVPKQRHKKHQEGISNYLIILTAFLLFICGKSSGQNFLSISAIEGSDSLIVTIKNTSKSDTVLFSLYSQYNLNKKWVTSSYDLFCDVNNPKTSIFILYPNEEIILTALKPTAFYSERKMKEGKDICTGCKRILFVGNKKENENMQYILHSNTF